MKRKILTTIFVTMLCALTACGSKDKNNDVEVVSNKTVETAKETTEAVAETKTDDKVSVAIGGWNNTEEWTIGADADIDVLTGDLENGMPTFSMLLPSKSNDYTITARNYENGKRVNETANELIISVTPTSKLKFEILYWPLVKDTYFHKGSHYYDFEQNNYAIDMDWIEDPNTPITAYYSFKNINNDCSIELRCCFTGIDGVTVNGTTDSDRLGFNNWIKSTTDYLKQQCEIMPNSYIPVTSNTTSEDYVQETENISENTPSQMAPQVWTDEAISSRQEFIDNYYKQYQKDTGETIELIYNNENDYSLIICDGAETYECILLDIGEGTYEAIYNDVSIAQVYNDEPDVFEVYALTEEFNYLNGYYY